MKKESNNYPINLYFIIEGSQMGMMGGVENSLYNTITNLDKNLFSTKIIFQSESKLFYMLKGENYNVQLIKGPIFKSIRYSFSELSIINPFAIILDLFFIIINSLNLINRLKFHDKNNIIITYGLMAHIYGSLSAKIYDVNCVWHLQDLISDRYFNLPISFMKLLARNCVKKIIVDGSSIADQFTNSHQNIIKTVVLLNGIDTTIYSKQKPSGMILKNYNISENDLVIGNVGRLVNWKGQKYLIDAFIELLHNHNNIKLLLVGDAIFENDNYYKSLKKLVKEYKLKNKVIFTGYLENLKEIYPIIDIYVHTSINKDTSPLALIGAMASGRPIVVFDIPGIDELIENNFNGIVVKSRSPENLVSGISKLITNINLRCQMGKNNSKIAANYFSIGDYIKRYQDELLNTLSLNN